MSVRSHAYEVLKKIVHLSNSSIPNEAKLDQMIQAISDAFQSERALFLKPEQIVQHGFFSRLGSEKKALWADEESSFETEEVLPEEEDLLRPPFVCVPLHDGSSFLGILYLHFSGTRRFLPEEMDLLSAIAGEVEGAIRQANLCRQREQVLSELGALHQLGMAVTSTLKVEDLLESIMRTGSKILKARGGVLRLEDKRTKELRVRSSLGDYHQHPFDEKLAKRVFLSRTPLSLNHFGEERPSLSVLSAPLLSKGRTIGTLTFYDKETSSPKFDEKDFQLLLTVANQISCSVEDALIYYETSSMARELEKRVGQLSTLWELSKALLTTVNLERILHMTLTSVTIGEGLGFNRAMLFLVNEREPVLEGKMAVGPDSAEEAGRIWLSLSEKKGNLSDRIMELESFPRDNSHLSAIVKGIKISLEQKQCILVRNVSEGRPFNIHLSQSEDGKLESGCGRGCVSGSETGCFVGKHLSRDPRVYSFATVPIWGKGKVIGVILVDNLYNQNPITEGDIHFLGMFSNQAGLAIENVILYRNLEEVHRQLKEAESQLVHQERMVALGEMAANVAHEIRNPLVSIGGFARRLYRSIPEEAPEKRYSQTIMIEVGRLERVLADLFSFTREEPLVLKELDVKELVDESLSMVSEGLGDGEIQIIREYLEKIPRVSGDYYQLRHAFFNLIDNACQAMKKKGTLSLRVSSFSRNGSSFVRVEIEDTGKGIDPESLHNIFNPFCSTREPGLGLGLPIVHKIILSHRGQIEVENHHGKGMSFIVTLPAVQEATKRPAGLS